MAWPPGGRVRLLPSIGWTPSESGIDDVRGRPAGLARRPGPCRSFLAGRAPGRERAAVRAGTAATRSPAASGPIPRCGRARNLRGHVRCRGLRGSPPALTSAPGARSPTCWNGSASCTRRRTPGCAARRGPAGGRRRPAPRAGACRRRGAGAQGRAAAGREIAVARRARIAVPDILPPWAGDNGSGLVVAGGQPARHPDRP
ncbi:hypothetical protein HBB16_13405 [Pseudonocardia sp. MCCB 268]|nr:hypothetical protein [Pseudonocardia cytotoxica]